MRPAVIMLVILVVVGLALDAVLFVVDEREQVVVTRLGKPRHTIRTPGFQWKMPFIEQVHVFDDVILAVHQVKRRPHPVIDRLLQVRQWLR